MQEELELMQRSSYYLDIRCCDELDEDQPLWCVDQRRLQCAMTTANCQVKLLLSLLELLYDVIMRGFQELEAFILKYDQGLVDGDMAASAQQTLKQTEEYVNDFKSRLTRNLGPMDLPNQLIPHTRDAPTQVSVSLVIQMPVIFNRLESCATSNTVHLSWEVMGEQSRELNQQFEICMQRLHPTTGEHDQSSTSTCRTYSTQVSNLIPDRHYRFTVRRVCVENLVHGEWMDTMILKTVCVSK